MVHAPGFFTFAAQLVRRLWSRSVAVIVSLSSLASNRKFERIGIVVFRSTTLCAAVSSRSNSARDTVISRLPVGAAAVSGIWGSWVALVTVGSLRKSIHFSLAKLYTEITSGASCHRAVCLILGSKPPPVREISLWKAGPLCV